MQQTYAIRSDSSNRTFKTLLKILIPLEAAFFREAHSSVPSIAVIDNARHDTFTRARPICRHKSLETKTYPRGHANLPTPDRSASESESGNESANGTFTRGARMTEMIPAERERTRVNKREIMTRPRPTFRTHTAARVRTRTWTFAYQRTYGRQSPAVRHAGFSGGATESEGATRDARRINEEARETRVRDRGGERERVDQRRGVLAWMTRHCRGARVPRNHTACTRVYTRTHAYAARAGTSEALSARYARVHWVTWKCVS